MEVNHSSPQEILDFNNYNKNYEQLLRNPSQRQITSVRSSFQKTLSPKRMYFETVNQNIAENNNPQQINQNLNPLIKDYKLKPLYELENNRKYQQMVENGSTHYRANFDNRNKIIWNNTEFRVFNRDHPNSLDILPLTDIPLKPVKDRSRLLGFEKRLPEEDPEIRSRLIQNENSATQLFNASASFRNYGETMPKSSYKDFYGSINQNQGQNQSINQGSLRKADDILRDQQQLRDTFMISAPSQRYNSVVNQSLQELPKRIFENQGQNKQQSQMQPQFSKTLNSSQSTDLFEREQNLNPNFNNQQLSQNKQMNAYHSVTKHMDTQGRKPPSRHYQLDENSQKIYSSLYPEPGVANKQYIDQFSLVDNQPHTNQFNQTTILNQSANINNNPHYQSLVKQQQFGQSLYDTKNNDQGGRPSYGSLIGLSRRIDRGIVDKQYFGDTFSQEKKYFDQIMNDQRSQRMQQLPNSHNYNTIQNNGLNILNQ